MLWFFVNQIKPPYRFAASSDIILEEADNNISDSLAQLFI